MIRTIVFLVAGLLSTGCNSLLYYPTHVHYFDPVKVHLDPESVTLMSRDGAKIDAWYFRTDQAPKPKAIFIFFHGNGQNMTSHYMSLAWLVPHGYDFFIFDYQGYGDSEGKPSPQKTVEDGEAALKYIAERNKDQVPVIIFGQSLGGAVALKTLIELKNKYPVKWIVIDSSFASYEVVGRRALSHSWITWLFQPLAYLVLSDTWAPDGEIKSLSPTPILVMHGDKDQTVDYKNGQDIFAQAGEPKEFWTIEGGRHTDAFWAHDMKYREKFLAKLDEILSH